MFRESTLRYMEKKSVVARYANEFLGVLRQKGVPFDYQLLRGTIDNLTYPVIGIKCYTPEGPMTFVVTGTDITCIPPDEMAIRIWNILPKGRDNRKGFSFI